MIYLHVLLLLYDLLSSGDLRVRIRDPNRNYLLLITRVSGDLHVRIRDINRRQPVQVHRGGAAETSNPRLRRQDRTVALLPCCPAALLPCYPAILLPCYPATLRLHTLASLSPDVLLPCPPSLSLHFLLVLGPTELACNRRRM